MKRIIAIALVLGLVAAACTSRSANPEDPTLSSTVAGTEGAGTSAGTATSDGPDSSGDGTSGSQAGTSTGPIGLFASSLERFDSCDAFLEHVKTEAIEQVGPYGFNSGGYYGGPVFAEDAAAEFGDDAAFDGGGDRFESVTTVAQAQQGVDFSGTNVQELGRRRTGHRKDRRPPRVGRCAEPTALFRRHRRRPSAAPGRSSSSGVGTRR